MEAYDTMAMPQYLASPLPLDQNVPNEDYLGAIPQHGMSEPHEAYDTGDFGPG